jgi:TAT (twin-arginine translocation) pathway signal sequence.
MYSNRRDFLKLAGATIAASAAGGLLTGGTADAGAGLGACANAKAFSGEMPKGLTFLTMRKNGVCSLGVKTNKGVLDVKAAAKLFKKKVPTLIDDVIQGGDQGLMALVRLALDRKSVV